MKRDELPMGFGHECSGTVVQVGQGVTRFKVGDHVATHNTGPYGVCFYCKRGQNSMCENSVSIRGAFAEYVRIPAAVAGAPGSCGVAALLQNHGLLCVGPHSERALSLAVYVEEGAQVALLALMAGGLNPIPPGGLQQGGAALPQARDGDGPTIVKLWRAWPRGTHGSLERR